MAKKFPTSTATAVYPSGLVLKGGFSQSQNTSYLTADTLYLIPFRLERTGTLSALYFDGGNTTTGTVKMGLYNSTGTLLGAGDDHTTTTAVVQRIALTAESGQSLDLTPTEIYYVGFTESAQVARGAEQFGVGSNENSVRTSTQNILEGASVLFSDRTETLTFSSTTTLPSSVTLSAGVTNANAYGPTYALEFA